MTSEKGEQVWAGMVKKHSPRSSCVLGSFVVRILVTVFAYEAAIHDSINNKTNTHFM